MIDTPRTAIEQLESRTHLTAVSSTDVLAGAASAKGLRVIALYLTQHPKAALGSYIDLGHSKQLFRSKNTSTLQIHLKKGASVTNAVKLLKRVAGLTWVSPNFIYANPTSEMTPNDPRWASEADPLAKIQLPQAWDVTTGSSAVTVAVLDDGVDMTNTDMQGAIWTNPGEIAGNGIDDDGNGYIDDVHGYDFGSNDNDPSPDFNTTYGLTDSHGTQVASVIAATLNNGVGTAGVAGGGVKIMPVRFYGAGVTTTSAAIAQSIAYAANNGAKVINMSFSFDPYMNDPAFAAATDLAYAKGVLWINSAGNNNVNNPPRTTIDKVLFVDNVDGNDILNTASNYGTATDLSAPGTNIQLESPGNQYYPGTGTSYSAAVTSGVASLIWSVHPTWTRDQVAAQLLGTADNIDALNPGYANQLGTGRVNAYKAVSATLAPPVVRGLSGITDGGSITSVPTTLSLSLYNVLAASTVNNNAFELRGAGADGVFNTADDTIVPLTLNTSYAIGTNALNFSIGGTLTGGKYRFTAKDTIADPFGQALDGNNDGVAGGAFTETFTYIPQPPIAPSGLVAAVSPYSQSECSLSWVDNSSDETSFVIERSSSSTFATIDKTYSAVANSTRYYDWGLSQASVYYYRIRAVNAVGASANTATATFSIPAPPPGIPVAPSVLAGATPATAITEVALSWNDNSNNETSFIIQRSSTSAFTSIDKTMTATANSNRYNDWGLTPGTTYYYRMAAVNGSDESTFSNTLIYQPAVPTTAPIAPSTMTSATVSYSATEVQLNWADNSNNETGFTVQRSLTVDFTTAVTISASSNSGQYNDWGLAVGTTYYYRVKATNAAGDSDWSNTTSVTTRGS